MARIGLFTYHADFATSEYIAQAAARSGDSMARIGACHPGEASDPAPQLAATLRAAMGAEDPAFVLFVDPPGPVWPFGWERLQCPSVAYLIDVHLNLQTRLQYAQFFDLIFVAQRDLVDAVRSAGFPGAEWLPIACDPLLHAIKPTTRDLDVGFVGQLGPPGSVRRRTLTTVLPTFYTNDYLQRHTPREMADVYARSKIVINASVNGDLNMRVFEGLASGALLLTDRIQNGLTELFEEDVHFVGYTSAEEAVDKVRFYLANESARRRIADAGRAEAFARHTYDHRWQQIVEAVAAAGTKRTAPIRTWDPTRQSAAYAALYEMLRLPRGIWRVRSQFQSAPVGVLVKSFIRAVARRLNATVPLTPNAVRAWRGAR